MAKNIDELNQLYKEAEESDRHVFAEMRSSVLLIAGEHYGKSYQRFFDRIRSSKELSQETRVRLTKNHTQKIVKAYVNAIASEAPGVQVKPQIESELQDQKSAELHQAVWEDIKQKNDLTETGLVMDWLDDYVGISEVCTKVYFDKDEGDIVDYEQAVDALGRPVFTNESGEDVTEEDIQFASQLGVQMNAQPKKDESKPIRTGCIKYETVEAFNLLRSPTAKRMSESEFLCIRKMVRVKDLKKMFPDMAEKINGSADKTFLVFDSSTYGYRQSEKTETLVKEFYFRKCAEYPNGYYYICTEEVVLDEGELPFGIFPIVVGQFDRAPTTPRAVGIVKTIRPYQVEINRTASKIAEHQMTLGDDKLITMNGSKMSAGAALGGIREVKVTGQPPIVLEGRAGGQFVDYMLSQIQELYQTLNVDEVSKKNSDGQYDVFSMLYQAARKKKFFQRYSARFEKFLKEVCIVSLELARNYMHPDAVVYSVGRREKINVQEFKNSSKLYYQIKVEPRSDDIETSMGKQLVASQIMQFVGSKLENEDIGKLIKNMPLANFDESFNDFTIDYENAKNMVLALDRGENPPAREQDNPEYMLKKLNHRMKMSDFNDLHPFIQQNYQMKIEEYSQISEMLSQQALANQKGLIPTTGDMVGVDVFVGYDPNDPTKTRRGRVPYGSVRWLIDTIEAQGTAVKPVQDLPTNLQAGIKVAPEGSESMAPPQTAMPGEPLA